MSSGCGQELLAQHVAGNVLEKTSGFFETPEISEPAGEIPSQQFKYQSPVETGMHSHLPSFSEDCETPVEVVCLTLENDDDEEFKTGLQNS